MRVLRLAQRVSLQDALLVNQVILYLVGFASNFIKLVSLIKLLK